MIGIGARLATLFAGNGLVVGLVVALGVMVLTWDRGRINSAVKRGVEQERAGVIQREFDSDAKYLAEIRKGRKTVVVNRPLFIHN